MSKEMREQIDRVKNWKQFLNENYGSEIQKLSTKLLSVRNNKEYDLIQDKIDRLNKLKKMGVEFPQNNLLSTSSNDFNSWFYGGVLFKEGKPIKLYHGTNKEDIKVVGEFYLTPNENYAKNFGNNIYVYYSNIANPLDLTQLGVDRISISELLDYLDKNGLITDSISWLRGGKAHALGSYDDKQPVWGWLKVKHQDIPTNSLIRNLIKTKYDSIKYYESYTNNTNPALCYLIFDEKNVWKT